MAARRSHYETLGVSRGATQEEIRAAYRRRVKESHPDQGGSDAEFVAVKEAFDVLSDLDRRHDYDLFLFAEPDEVDSDVHASSPDDAPPTGADSQHRPPELPDWKVFNPELAIQLSAVVVNLQRHWAGALVGAGIGAYPVWEFSSPLEPIPFWRLALYILAVFTMWALFATSVRVAAYEDVAADWGWGFAMVVAAGVSSQIIRGTESVLLIVGIIAVSVTWWVRTLLSPSYRLRLLQQAGERSLRIVQRGFRQKSRSARRD